MLHDYAPRKRCPDYLFGLRVLREIKILSTASHRQSSGASLWSNGRPTLSLYKLFILCSVMNSRPVLKLYVETQIDPKHCVHSDLRLPGHVTSSKRTNESTAIRLVPALFNNSKLLILMPQTCNNDFQLATLRNNHDVQELWFQQDGATCHTARAIIDLLKDTFGDRLISRFGPVNWPPRSCDLTPLDYFLWGYVKSLVYADKPQTLDHLEDNIHRVIADIRPHMLEKVIENWTSRLDCI
ncbi:uncharacterized protein TNCV_4908661 [Trichonephila clavipes]|uniref:Transposase n=1 Tax=Trichonephila clavipes TaxID=2585209 RepID=A0A8X6V8C7_TRICX|nr:uncharacterized protein TNCV_4908661 [Trichonephila clavipes]